LLSDDVKLKLAEHISSGLDIRYVLLIPVKKNKQHITAELLDLINEYLTPVRVTKHTLNKWLADCIVESVECEGAGQAANKLDYKSPPPRPDLVAELMSGMRARQERDDGLFAGVRRSMAYDQLSPRTRCWRRGGDYASDAIA